MSNELSRRDYLAGLGSVSLTSAAGCLNDDSPSENVTSDNGQSNDSELTDDKNSSEDILEEKIGLSDSDDLVVQEPLGGILEIEEVEVSKVSLDGPEDEQDFDSLEELGNYEPDTEGEYELDVDVEIDGEDVSSIFEIEVSPRGPGIIIQNKIGETIVGSETEYPRRVEVPMEDLRNKYEAQTAEARNKWEFLEHFNSKRLRELEENEFSEVRIDDFDKLDEAESFPRALEILARNGITLSSRWFEFFDHDLDENTSPLTEYEASHERLNRSLAPVLEEVLDDEGYDAMVFPLRLWEDPENPDMSLYDNRKKHYEDGDYHNIGVIDLEEMEMYSASIWGAVHSSEASDISNNLERLGVVEEDKINYFSTPLHTTAIDPHRADWIQDEIDNFVEEEGEQEKELMLLRDIPEEIIDEENKGVRNYWLPLRYGEDDDPRGLDEEGMKRRAENFVRDIGMSRYLGQVDTEFNEGGVSFSNEYLEELTDVIRDPGNNHLRSDYNHSRNSLKELREHSLVFHYLAEEFDEDVKVKGSWDNPQVELYNF